MHAHGHCHGEHECVHLPVLVCDGRPGVLEATQLVGIVGREGGGRQPLGAHRALHGRLEWRLETGLGDQGGRPTFE